MSKISLKRSLILTFVFVVLLGIFMVEGPGPGTSTTNSEKVLFDLSAIIFLLAIFSWVYDIVLSIRGRFGGKDER